MKLHVRITALFGVILLGLGSLCTARSQEPAKPAPKPTDQAQKSTGQAQKPSDYTLRVSTRDLITISLKAEKAQLSIIASEMARKLKIPVMVGKSAQTREVSTDFKGLTLEPAMHFLAPVVYIDYEINRSPGAQPQPIGIYLYGYEDPQPPINAVVPNSAEAILIEGHTEDGVEGAAGTKPQEEEEPLKVVYEQNALTVKAKKQVLSVVLYKIATELGIPFEMRGDSVEVVDLDIDKMPVEDAVLRLSPHVRLYVRADLQRSERRPFRMVLVPANKG